LVISATYDGAIWSLSEISTVSVIVEAILDPFL
jgi:hypothetical protein